METPRHQTANEPYDLLSSSKYYASPRQAKSRPSLIQFTSQNSNTQPSPKLALRNTFYEAPSNSSGYQHSLLYPTADQPPSILSLQNLSAILDKRLNSLMMRPIPSHKTLEGSLIQQQYESTFSRSRPSLARPHQMPFSNNLIQGNDLMFNEQMWQQQLQGTQTDTANTTTEKVVTLSDTRDTRQEIETSRSPHSRPQASKID